MLSVVRNHSFLPLTRLKRELLKPKFYLNESGNLVRVSSNESIADAIASESSHAQSAVKSTTDSTATTTASSSSSPVFKIYYDFVSSSCRALYVFLKLAAVDFEAHPVQLRAGDQFQPEFEKLSPARRLPVLEDADGFVLREAMPICRYVAEKEGIAQRWCYGGGVGGGAAGTRDDEGNADDNNSVDIRSRIMMDEYLSWHQSQLRPTCLQIFTQATLTPILSGQPPDFRRLRVLKSELDKHCQYLENVFLQRGPFIGGEDIGICDLFAVW